MGFEVFIPLEIHIVIFRAQDEGYILPECYKPPAKLNDAITQNTKT
jgi:hypothetical protein